MWSILENIPCAPEKNVYSLAIGMLWICLLTTSCPRCNSKLSDFVDLLLWWSVHCEWDIKSPTVLLLLYYYQSLSLCLWLTDLYMWLFPCWTQKYLQLLDPLHGYLRCTTILHLSVFVLKSSLPDGKDEYFSFLLKTIKFLPFNLQVSLDLKWLSCRRHIDGSYFSFLIHCDILCLLIEIFSLLRFWMIIDRYEFSALLLPVDLVFLMIFFLVLAFFSSTQGFPCEFLAGLV